MLLVRKDGERLAAIRRDHKDTQRGLARALGIPRWTLHRIEAGKQPPSVTILRAFARHYGISVCELLGEERAA